MWLEFGAPAVQRWLEVCMLSGQEGATVPHWAPWRAVMALLHRSRTIMSAAGPLGELAHHTGSSTALCSLR
jgi:hypothetical protein